MKKISIVYLRGNSTRFIYKIFIAVLISNIAFIHATAQDSIHDFTVINWGTTVSQKYTVSEAQGEVVNGKLYTFGGFDSQKSTFTPTKRSFVFNPVDSSWSAIADLPHTPTGENFGGITHAGVTTDSTDIYIAGGYTSNASGTGQIFGTKQVWKYVISQDAYFKLPDLPIDIAAGQLEYLNGKLHYISGTNQARTVDLDNHYVLDLNNQAAGWTTLAPIPNPRQHAGSAVYGGKIYFIGGQHEHDAELVTQKDVHVYDPTIDSWKKAANLPVPAGANGRGHISSAVAVIGKRILVLGGEIVHQSSVRMVSAYSPATDLWENLTPLPQNRFSGVAGVLNNIIYYTGGSGTSTTFKGIPEINVLSSAVPANTASAQNTPGRNLKKPLVFPNPLQKQFKITFPDTYRGNFSFAIVSTTGKIYNLGRIRIQPDATINMDISRFSLAQGVYFLKINSETINEKIKLIVK
jgi:N-acetylneuraminic acid mutarotase